MLEIRAEQPGDAPGIRALHLGAFEGALEADLVDRIRVRRPGALSLVAEDGDLLGHILFSPVRVEAGTRPVVGAGLGPMAVRPGHQRRGIGSALVRHGLGVLRERGCPFVVVVGHPTYYPRFGFEPASRHGLASQWEGMPDEAFMALILEAEAMAGVSGVAFYLEEFNAGT